MQANILVSGSTRNIYIYYLLPILAGGFIATIVCLDLFVINLSVVADIWKELEELASFPYLFSALAISVAFGFPFCLRSFWKSKQALLIGVITTIYLEGVVLFATLNLYELFLFIFLGFWLARVLLHKESIFISSPLFILNIALFSLVVLSFGNSMHKLESTRGILAVFLRVIVLVFLMLNYIRTKESLLKTIHVVFIAGSLASLAAIAQWGIWYTTGTVLTLAPKKFNIFAVTPLGVFFRASAFFSASNVMGGYLSSSVVLMFYFAVSRTFSSKMRVFYSLGSVLSAVAIILAFSRSSLLGIAFACVIFPYFKKPSLWLHYTLVLFLVASLILATGLLSPAYEFFSSFNPGAAGARIILMQQAIRIFLDRPLTGCGIYAFQAYPGDIVKSENKEVHNAILHVLSECGLAAGVLYFFIFLLMFIRLIRSVMTAEQAREKVILKGLTFAFMVLFVEMQFDIFTFYPNTWMYVALFESAILILGRRGATPESNIHRRDVV